MTKMQTSTWNNCLPSTKCAKSEAGFSLLEMVVATFILTGALLGMASAIGVALMATNAGKGLTNSKLLVVSLLEQMETLRDTGQLSFEEISNQQVEGSAFPGFPTEFLPISSQPGPDGVFGTEDDLVTPGPDGIYNTADDVENPNLARPNVSRQVIITELNPLLKRIQVTVRYSPKGGDQKELVGVSYLNDNAHSSFVP
jgi:type II secretory pathway pseudopilin PulG